MYSQAARPGLMGYLDKDSGIDKDWLWEGKDLGGEG
jgi:hypothetical protein